MVFIWDYDIKELKKTEAGRILILERMINYGPGKEKIKLADVKKYWDKLHLRVSAKRLMELLLWGKIITKSDSKCKTFQQMLGMEDDEYFAFCLKTGFKNVSTLRRIFED